MAIFTTCRAHSQLNLEKFLPFSRVVRPTTLLSFLSRFINRCTFHLNIRLNNLNLKGVSAFHLRQSSRKYSLMCALQTQRVQHLQSGYLAVPSRVFVDDQGHHFKKMLKMINSFNNMSSLSLAIILFVCIKIYIKCTIPGQMTFSSRHPNKE